MLELPVGSSQRHKAASAEIEGSESDLIPTAGFVLDDCPMHRDALLCAYVQACKLAEIFAE